MKNAKTFHPRSLLSLVALLCCAAMLLTACGSPALSPTNTQGSEKTLTMAIAAETTTLSPLYMVNANYSTAQLVYENLVNFDNGRVVPGLAERWEYNDDQTELTFYLRKDVQFHNGDPLTAETVKKNLEHKHSNPAFYSLKGITDIINMEVVDKHTLKLTYSHPFYAYLQDFCWPDVTPIVAEELLIAGDFQTVAGVIGTGPYIYNEMVPGQYTRFVRNENYWGEKPDFDEVIVKYIPDSTSRIQALKTGEIDMIFGSALIGYDEYDQIIKLDGIGGQLAENDTRVRDITLNASRPFMSDLNVRKAIAYAINKEEINETIFSGYEPPAKIPVTHDTPYADVKLDAAFSYDPEKAVQLLEESGWVLNEKTGIREKGGQALSLVMTMEELFDAGTKPVANILKSQLQKVGIEINIKGQEQMQWYADYLSGNFDITLWHTQAAFASPHTWFTPMDTMYPQTASLKGLSDSGEFFAAINRLVNMKDEKEIRETYTYLFNYDLGNVIDIPLTYQKDLIVYNTNKIAGYTFTRTPYFFDILSLKAK